MALIERMSEAVVATAATLVISTRIVRLTGTTSIATIIPPFGGFSGMVILVPTAGAVATLTTGNIAVAVTMADLRATVLVYSKAADKWYPGAIS